MNWKQLLEHWNRTYIQLIEVQYRRIKPTTTLKAVTLRSNMILFQTEGRTACHLDEEVFYTDGYYVLHANKGQRWEMAVLSESAVVYQIFYHSWPIFPHDGNNREATSAELREPFGFSPVYPLPLHERLDNLHREWNRMSTISRLHAKGQLYQLIYEVLLQADQSSQGEGSCFSCPEKPES